MAVHIFLGELDTDGEYANGYDNAGELEGYIIDVVSVISPRTGIEDVRSMGT